jgi:hypothetical protein
MDRSVIQAILIDQSIDVDQETLANVKHWYETWRTQWSRIEALRVEEDPAPLWCWPPCK